MTVTSRWSATVRIFKWDWLEQSIQNILDTKEYSGQKIKDTKEYKILF